MTAIADTSIDEIRAEIAMLHEAMITTRGEKRARLVRILRAREVELEHRRGSRS